MPAPAAVYIIVAVVGAAAATFALKEFVYEPHFSEKFQEFKNQARAYWRKRAARGTRVRPFQFAHDSGDDDGNGGDRLNGVELEGLFEMQKDSPQSKLSGEMMLKADASTASITAIATARFPGSISKTTGNDLGLIQADQQIRQRKVAPLLDLDETDPPITIELEIPSEPTTTIETPSNLNPFLDQKLVLVNDEARLLALDTFSTQSSFQPRTDYALSPGPNFNSFHSSPLSHAYSLGAESPVILSPYTSPQIQPRAFVSGTLSPTPALAPSPNSSNNPWETVQRVVSPPLGTDLGMSMSSWDSDPIPDSELDASLLALSLSRDGANTTLSPEMVWAHDDAGSEASFTTNSSSLTSSTFDSSVRSQIEEGGGAHGEPNPFLVSPRLERTGVVERPASSLSDAEWERFSDADR